MKASDAQAKVKAYQTKQDVEYQKELSERQKCRDADRQMAIRTFDQTFETKIEHEIERAASKGLTSATIRLEGIVGSDIVADMAVARLHKNGFSAVKRWVTFNMRYSDDTPEVGVQYWTLDVSW